MPSTGRIVTKVHVPGAARRSHHSRRHTYATLDPSVGLRDVQDAMGHRATRTIRLHADPARTSTATPPTP